MNAEKCYLTGIPVNKKCKHFDNDWCRHPKAKKEDESDAGVLCDYLDS